VRQYLDGDVTSEPAVVRAVDLSHAARAKERADFVWTEAGSGGQRHFFESARIIAWA
jgi:hypothetical protein